MPFSKTLVSRRKVAAARALCSAISIEASVAPSIRWKATRLPPESTTATFIFQSRFLASATTTLMAACARSSDIGGPQGTSNGIFSGTISRGFRATGCCPRVRPAATARFFSDIWFDSQYTSDKATHSKWWPKQRHDYLGQTQMMSRLTQLPFPHQSASEEPEL